MAPAAHPSRRRAMALGLGAVGLASLAACAPGYGQAGGTPTGPAAADVDKDIDALGEVTLKVWDQEVRGAQNDAITALIEAFQQDHPNITVDRRTQSFDDLQKQTALALSGNDVPDVLQVNNARADMGIYVKAGQLTDLSGYAEAYGWDQRFPAAILALASYSPDGARFGEGSLWGLPQTGEIVGIYSSTERLSALGVKAPSTWEELFSLVCSAAAAGDGAPILLGNLEKWPALHVFGPLQAHFSAPDAIRDLAMGNPGASWTDRANVAALQQMGEWGTTGALGRSPNGLSYDAAWPDFADGGGTLLIGGSWLGPDLETVMGDDLHFSAPPPGAGGTLASTGGTGLPFCIPAGARNPAAAAAYLDFITSEDAMALIAEKGGMPVLRTAELAPAEGVNAEIYRAFADVSTNGVLLPYLDYATPSFADTAGDTLQELIGGQRTAEEAAQLLQDDYGDFTRKNAR